MGAPTKLNATIEPMVPNRRSTSPAHSTGEQQLLSLVRRVSETIGAEFFHTLVNQLMKVLGAECVYVGEFVGTRTKRVRTLAACVEGNGMKHFEFPLADSPDAEVARGNPSIYGKGVQEAFPKDERLRDLEIEAFVGVALNNAEGTPCGLIAALYRQPVDLAIHYVYSMLTMFAPRAAAELSRKQAEDTLRENEQRYRAFVQMNPDACWRAEFDEPMDIGLPEEEQLERILRDSYVAECNDALAKRFGREGADELIGITVADAVRDILDTATIRLCLKNLIRSGYQHTTIEIAPVGSKGNRGHFLLTHWGIVENGKLRRVWGSSRDVTKLKTLEAQFRHAQKMESLGRLAAGVAHDFNNLLAVIRGYSSQLLDCTEEASNSYIGLQEIRKAAEKGALLTNQLLAFSRKHSTELQVLDLKSIITDDVDMLRQLIGRKIELVTELEPSPGLVRANIGYMHQVLVNLAVNARDAMPNGGRLIIALSSVEIGENRPPDLRAVEPGRYVRLTVSDNGVGMSLEVQEHLFEPFFTTKEVGEGTGLGLSTVYGIVRQSGGYITVDTESGKGTTFELFLPRAS
jgi:signal transduction histidine kinase